MLLGRRNEDHGRRLLLRRMAGLLAATRLVAAALTAALVRLLGGRCGVLDRRQRLGRALMLFVLAGRRIVDRRQGQRTALMLLILAGGRVLDRVEAASGRSLIVDRSHDMRRGAEGANRRDRTERRETERRERVRGGRRRRDGIEGIRGRLVGLIAWRAAIGSTAANAAIVGEPKAIGRHVEASGLAVGQIGDHGHNRRDAHANPQAGIAVNVLF